MCALQDVSCCQEEASDRGGPRAHPLVLTYLYRSEIPRGTGTQNSSAHKNRLHLLRQDHRHACAGQSHTLVREQDRALWGASKHPQQQKYLLWRQQWASPPRPPLFPVPGDSLGLQDFIPSACWYSRQGPHRSQHYTDQLRRPFCPRFQASASCYVPFGSSPVPQTFIWCLAGPMENRDDLALSYSNL